MAEIQHSAGPWHVDNIVVDAVIDRVRDRAKQALAQKRLGPMSTKGNA